MKKLLALFVLTLTFGAAALAVSAAPTAATLENGAVSRVQLRQILLGQNRRHGRWNRRNDNNNVRYETRTVYKGRKVYRDTYRITYKNGREKSKRISHVRIN